MIYRFNFRDVFANFDLLLEGLVLTLQLSALTMAFGLAIGISGALARSSGPAPLRWGARAYVEAIRNTPLLVQIFLIYFGLPGLGLKLDSTTAAVVALTINLGAYATEIIRAGVEAIPRSQVEAGLSLGLSRLQVFRYIILFPALRIIYPALASQFILLMLATSVVSQIAAQELFHMAGFIQSRTFRDFEVYLVVAGIYLVTALAFRLIFSGIYYVVFGRR
ncbi:MAG: amino acid ABC transporter permease [Alphaproteobacteria bacterium]|nr:amino acid ABC transporter permease [Alphaproteobacteria bacterium]